MCHVLQVVDMFGCGLPVLSCDYPCISELVEDKVNGRLFSNAAQLAGLLEETLLGFSLKGHCEALNQLRWNVLKARVDKNSSWEACWEQTVKPLFNSVLVD